MTTEKFNPRTAVLLLFIFATAAARVVLNFNYHISSLANFSPLGAMALFGGAYFNKKWKAFAFPLLMLLLSDFILHQTVFKKYGNGFLYGGWYWVYSAFALMVFVGQWFLRKVTVKNLLLSTIVCVLIHWIVTDFGVWLESTTWPQNFGGFITCLENAIPYEWRFMAGTVVYGGILFGVFEWMERKYFSLQIN